MLRNVLDIPGPDDTALQEPHEHVHGARDASVAGFPAAHRAARMNGQHTRQALGAETKGVADMAEFGGGHWFSVSRQGRIHP